MATSTGKQSPSPALPWEILDLIANNLDPKTLATAACVSKPWYAALSSGHQWEQLYAAYFPSLLHFKSIAAPPIPYHRLYNIGSTAIKRRQQTPPNPKITLQNLIFIINLTNPNSPPITITRPGYALPRDHKSLFRFDFDVRDCSKWLNFELSDETNVTWNIVLRGIEGVFTMMDCGERLVSGSYDGCFTAELPTLGCCCASSSGWSGGMLAEMRLVTKEEVGMKGRGRWWGCECGSVESCDLEIC